MKKEELRLQKSSVVSAKNHLKLIKVISEINIFKPYRVECAKKDTMTVKPARL